MGLSPQGEKTYQEVFGSYPWNTIPVVLEKGAIELIDAEEMEVGELYLFARKGIFGAGTRRDQKITTEVLKYQISSILKQDDSKYSIDKIINERLWMYEDDQFSYYQEILRIPDGVTKELKELMEKYGLDYRPSIDLSDTFIMACYDTGLRERIGLTSKTVKNAYNNVKRFLGTVFGNRDIAFIQKIQEKDSQAGLNPRKILDIEKNRLMYNVNNDSYITQAEEINEWAYVFKIQLQNLKYEFMNWDTLPF